MQCAFVEQNKPDLANMRRMHQSFASAGDGNLRRQLNRITVNPGRNRRKRDGAEPEFVGNLNRLDMAAGQGFRFSLPAAAPNRADGVNDILGGQSASRGSDSLAGGKASLLRDDGFAGIKNRWASCAMDSAIDAATAHEGGVRGVHDGVASFTGDVARSFYDEEAVG